MGSRSFFRVLTTCVIGSVALTACVVAPLPQNQVIYPQGSTVESEIVVGVAPPAPYVEVIPAAPFVGALWINGYWGWSQGRHQWVSGRYVQPRPGYRWQSHQWVRGPRGHWHLRGGGWVR